MAGRVIVSRARREVEVRSLTRWRMRCLGPYTDRKGKVNVSREKTVSFYSRTPDADDGRSGSELVRAWWGEWVRDAPWC